MGGVYEFGQVPQAGCQVTDAQDGPQTVLPVITSDLDAYGLGNQTVTCTYTDLGGLTNSAVAAYTIVDTTPPTIDQPGNMVVEATGPSGAVASFAAPATHDLVDGDGTAVCEPASGSTFALRLPRFQEQPAP